MHRDLQIHLAQRLLAHVEAGTTDLATSQMQVPVTEYLDVPLWHEEVEQLYKRLPIVACLSSELPRAGSFLAHSLLGVPILLTRDDTGTVNAFLNVCRHRGGRVAPPTACGGTAKRFSCSYHGWTYDNRGRLLGVACAEHFGELDRTAAGLTRLQADERAGLVFVILTPHTHIDIDEYLAGVDRQISDHAAGLTFTGSRQVDAANWKLVLEGHLESYHFATLHAKTIAPFMVNNCATVDRFGPHLLITFCNKNILSLRDRPQSQWEPLRDELINPQYLLFPGTTLTLFEGGVLSQSITPGIETGRSQSRLAYACRADVAAANERLDFVTSLVESEDYRASLDIFAGLRSGAQSHVTFGRNEPGPIFFHEALRAQRARARAG